MILSNVQKIYLKFLIFSIVLVVSYTVIDYLYFANQTQQKVLDNALNKIVEREHVFKNFISSSEDSLYGLRSNKFFIDNLKGQKNIKDLQQVFLTISKSQKDYMQLRYIDKNGFEVIRIDRDKAGDTPYIIAENKLQNKLNRYYFKDSITKPLEKVWFSSLDLNIEREKLQIPYNPTLRVILPISVNDEFHGILIINYFMNRFLNRFLNLPLYDCILFDSNGYILKHYDHSKDWSYYQKEKYNISNEFKDTKEDILSYKQLVTDNFVFKRLNIPTQNQLSLLLKFKDSSINEQEHQKMVHYITVTCITFLLSLILTLIIGKRIGGLFKEVENKTLEQKTLLSLFDEGGSVLFKCRSDRNWSIDFISPSVINLLGYTENEFLYSKITYTKCIYKDDVSRFFEEIRIAKKLKTNFFKHEPYRIVTKKGEIKWVLDYVVSHKNIDGKVTHYVGYLIDVTYHVNIRRNLEKFINTQDNIVILTDGKELNFANEKFFRFLGFTNLLSFKEQHSCICEFFIENDKFFHLGKIDDKENWIKKMQLLPAEQRIVSMMGTDFNIYAFSVAINEFDKDLLIVSFTDISQTMIEHFKLEAKIIHDKLTSAYNREYFEQNYQNIINKYEGDGFHLAIALLDIDFFKTVNDTYGHDVGDDVLIQFVKTIQKYSRQDDILIRWGGEEFILILKVTSKKSLIKALEHIRKVLELKEYEIVGHKTCSIGGTLYQRDEDIEKTIKRADDATYKAKNTGRNKVVVI